MPGSGEGGGLFNFGRRDVADVRFEKIGTVGVVRLAEAKLEAERTAGDKIFIPEEGHEETDAEFAARQKARGQWGRRVKEIKNADGTIVSYEIEKATDYRQRLETIKSVPSGELDEDKKVIRVSWREADARVRAEAEKLSQGEGWLKRLSASKEKLQVLTEIAPYLPHDKWLEFIKDQEKIPLSIKNEAREARMGSWKRGVATLDKSVKEGVVLEDSAEYNDRALELYNIAKKNIVHPDEIADFVTSEAGESLRPMRATWLAVPTSFLKELKESGRISPSEQRNINAMRRPYAAPQQTWTGARLTLGEELEVPPDNSEDRFHPKDDAVKWAERRQAATTRIIENFESGKAVSLADKEQAEEELVLARLVLSGKTIDQLTDEEAAAAVAGTRFAGGTFAYHGQEKSTGDGEAQKKFLRMLARDLSDAAEKAVATFAGREKPDELAILMQDDDEPTPYHPIMAQIEVTKMVDFQTTQDTRFVEAWLDNKFVYGEPNEIYRIATTDQLAVKFPWPPKERIDKINARRAVRLRNLNRRRKDEGLDPLSAKEAELEALPYSSAEFISNQRKK
jgi:hypothetical protein